MRVILLRHAQTAGNLLGHYVGRSDEGLCREGKKRASSLASSTKLARVYTSTLKRTIETAELLYPSAELIKCKDLNEMDFGDFEQKSWRDLALDRAYQTWVDSDCEDVCPGGEGKASFTRRTVDCFADILQKERALGARELVAVVHGGTIMALLSSLALPVRPYFDWSADYCGGYLLEYRARDAEQRALNLIEAIRPREARV